MILDLDKDRDGGPWLAAVDYSQLEMRILRLTGIPATCSLYCTCDEKPNRRREAVMATRAKHDSR